MTAAANQTRDLAAAPPRVSVVLPVYNGEKFLAEAIDSILKQSFRDFELIAIDDGSTDRTVEVARAEGVDHIVRLTNHKGLAAAFQAGLDAGLKLGADVIVQAGAGAKAGIPDDDFAAAFAIFAVAHRRDGPISSTSSSMTYRFSPGASLGS